MNFSVSNQNHQLTNGQLTLAFSQHNVLQTIKSGSVMLNQFETPEWEQALSNIYLRVKQGNEIIATPLVFFGDNAETFRTEAGNIVWKTENETFRATVTFSLAANESIAFLTTDVENLQPSDLTFDLIYGQDLGLADEGAVKTNEAYASQYLDQQVFNTEAAGYTICARQNLPGSTGNPSIQVGSLSPVVSFSTDGIQFFGKSYKFTNQPEALIKPTLDNVKYQYEMAYAALQSADITLKSGDTSSTVFYMTFKPHREKSNVSEAESVEHIAAHYEAPAKDKAVSVSAPEFDLCGQSVLAGSPLSSDEVTEFFGTGRRFAEEKNGVLLSFFHGDSQYVTLQEKELYLERSTGHMVSSGNNQNFTNAVLSSTHGMYGVFNSHLVLGNTSFNKLLGVDRTFLNPFKSTGQRIWVKVEGEYKVLTMPSAFEAGANFSRWVYKINGGYLQVRCFSACESTAVQMDIETINISETLDIKISNQLIMGNNEKDAKVSITHSGTFHSHHRQR